VNSTSWRLASSRRLFLTVFQRSGETFDFQCFVFRVLVFFFAFLIILICSFMSSYSDLYSLVQLC
jgi:hypothetical protein